MLTNFKFLASILFLLSQSATSYAAEAGGSVYYLKGGEVISHEMNLSVASRGEGTVEISSEGFSLSTDDFFSYEKNGATVFYAVFKGSQNSDSFAGTMVFRGKYVRGSNLAIWDGDIFTSEDEIDDQTDSESIQQFCENGTFTYTGGFFFHSIIEQ